MQGGLFIGANHLGFALMNSVSAKTTLQLGALAAPGGRTFIVPPLSQARNQKKPATSPASEFFNRRGKAPLTGTPHNRNVAESIFAKWASSCLIDLWKLLCLCSVLIWFGNRALSNIFGDSSFTGLLQIFARFFRIVQHCVLSATIIIHICT